MKKYVFATKERIEKYKGFKSTMHITPLDNDIIKNTWFRRGGSMAILRNNLLNHVARVGQYVNYLHSKGINKPSKIGGNNDNQGN